MGGELAVEFGEQHDAVGEAILGRPGHARAQGQRGLGVEQYQAVEAPAQLAAGIGRVA